MSDREILVQKFGGSSLADLKKLRLVAEKIVATRQQGYDLVVVVSAMGDTTDDLLEMAKGISANPSRRELDMLLSVGERISMALMSIAIQSYGYEAVSLTGSQCGIITTHSHSNARIMDVRPFRVQDELDQGRIVIVAGYQGSSYRRDVTTLGRGGSDTTAVALAAALGAQACEIYSDVDGVFSADPRVVLDAHQLEELSYEEMQEMARSGARVLNEEAVNFARRAKIALYARKTHAQASQGTMIRRIDLDEEGVRRAELGCPAVAVSHIRRGLWIEAQVSADEVMATLGEVGGPIIDWQPGRRAAVFVGLDDLHGEDVFRDDLSGLGADVEVASAGLVSVIGRGIGATPVWALRAREALKSGEVSPYFQAVYPDRLSWVIASEDVEGAARLLHGELVS